jgi:type II restriction/modification system DNA methylase subunit YeeA
MTYSFSAQEFVYKWKQSELRERASSQEHFIDVCHLIGHETPAEADPVGEWFTFEARLTKDIGGKGWADVWKRGFFAWEYKGKHEDLDKAYQQLLWYREALLNPPLLVVSDMERIIIHTNFTNTVKQKFEITLDDLLNQRSFNLLRALFYDPDIFRSDQTTQQVTEEAAAEFARLADLLRRWGEDPYEIAHFLIRLLFCLFAEDVGLLPKDIFTRLVTQTRKNHAAFAQQLKQLFSGMVSGGWFGSEQIPNFDGGLFEDDRVLELDSEGIEILLKVSSLDWSSIEPAIIGTLFERSLDPSKRAQVGAHYTSKEDIRLVTDPVLMEPLEERWEAVQEEAKTLAKRRDKTKNKSQRTRVHNEMMDLLRVFADEIASVQVLDPACGSGNFLYVALQQLLDLEKEVISFAGKLGGVLFFPKVSPSQLYGLEVDAYAYELAQATIWIGYIQWLQENGFGVPSEPILKPLRSIKRMDAIIRRNSEGKPAEPVWPEADVIIGNPPYLGSRKMRPYLGDMYCDALLEIYGNRLKGLPDLICYWFEKARAMISAGEVKRAGLLATQAIRGGTNRQVLDRIKQSGDIFMAWSDREWVLDGATVHVSIVGFNGDSDVKKVLDGVEVEEINSDLTAEVDLSSAQKLNENSKLSFQGVVLRGPFNIPAELATVMLEAKGNPNGRPNSDVIKDRRTGQDVVGILSNEFVIDFGVDMPIEEASQYVMPFEYLEKYVYPIRQKARQREAREQWWIHWRAREEMRKKLSKLKRYVATPRVGKHRIFVWLDSSILPDTALVAFAREDDYFMGVLHSRIHELWARRKGTQLRDAESGFRYTSTTVFETFPLPWPPGNEPLDDPRLTTISEAAKELIKLRDEWLNPTDTSKLEMKERTLTNLYNENPTWLRLTHRIIDEAVSEAYGWSADLGDNEILLKLLELNHERASNS